MLCFGILLMFCQQPTTAPSIDAYCSSYRRVIAQRGDSIAVGKLPSALRRRLAANDVVYRCRCENWSDPICGK